MTASLAGLFSVELTFTALGAFVSIIALDLGASPAAMAWLLTGPLMLRAIVVPLVGRVADSVDLRALWIIALVGALVFWPLCALANSAYQLVVFRLLAAAAETAVVPLTLVILARAESPDRHDRVFGYWAATLAIAPLFGLVIGGYLTGYLSWRVLFILQVPVGVAALVLGTRYLRSLTPVERRPFDPRGAAVLAVALTSLVLFLDRAPHWGLRSIHAMLAITALICSVAMFVRLERRAASPLFPFHQLRHAPVRRSLILLAVSNAGFMCGFFVSAILVSAAAGYSAMAIALALAPRALAFGFTGYLVGRFAHRRARSLMCGIGVLMIGISLLLFDQIGNDSDYLVIAAALTCAGVGLGLVTPAATAAALAGSTAESAGGLSGLVQMVSSLGGALGVAGAVAGAGLLTQQPEAGSDYSAALVTGAAVSIATLLAARGLHQAHSEEGRVHL